MLLTPGVVVIPEVAGIKNASDPTPGIVVAYIGKILIVIEHVACAVFLSRYRLKYIYHISC